MKTHAEVKKIFFKNPEVKRLYDEMQPEFDLMKTIIAVRIKKNMTQKELAKKIGTKQSAISRLENGNSNPSLSFLKKVSSALDRKLQITFVKK